MISYFGNEKKNINVIFNLSKKIYFILISLKYFVENVNFIHISRKDL